MPEDAVGSPSIIASDLLICGDVHTEGDIQILGKIEGEIHSRSVTIGESGHIKGKIFAEQVCVRGAIEGPVTANSVIMDRTANVVGSVFHNSLSVHPEAVHDGRAPWRLDPLADRLNR